MSGRILKTANKTLKYFTNPLVQGKYQVVPPPHVPDHIIRPSFVNNPNPEFGKYEGRPEVHSPIAIESILYFNQRIEKISSNCKSCSWIDIKIHPLKIQQA